MKKVIFLGAGATSIFSAIILKHQVKDLDVLIIEKREDALKKLSASGNGKANLANLYIDNSYHNEDFVKRISQNIKTSDILKIFDELGIKTKAVGNLIYPISESAKTVVNKLLEAIDKLNIKINYNEEIIDYNCVNNKIIVESNINKYECEFLVIGTGGYTSSKLGGSLSMIELLKKHNYQISKLSPSLCPIKTQEKTLSLNGVRVKAKASLFQNEKLIHEEDGEVLFKKDGLSGIVIFNLSMFISHLTSKENVKIKLDLLPNISEETLNNELKDTLNHGYSLLNFYESYLNPKLALYVFNLKDKSIKNMKELTFTFKDFYDSDFALVMSGGIALSNLKTESLESSLENHVYFSGEILDVDGVTGGFNLLWAFKSGAKVAYDIIAFYLNKS